MSMPPCPICSFPCTKFDLSPGGGRYNVECVRCGKYSITSEAEHFLPEKFSDLQIANISGFIRNNQDVEILERDLARLGSLPTPFVAEKAQRLLLALAREYPVPGTEIQLALDAFAQDTAAVEQIRSQGGTYPDGRFQPAICEASKLMAVSSAAAAEELDYLVREFLVGRGFLAEGDINGLFTITATGWERIDESKITTYANDTGFIAMAFQAELTQAYDDAIEPAVRAAGYRALRIDRVEHNNRIDDEIIAKIRQTKFLVADFTENRPGVYFEAGLALGLGHEVIWTVRYDQRDTVHFDTRQHNFIRWTADNLSEFKTALQNRVEATIGKGPLPPITE